MAKKLRADEDRDLVTEVAESACIDQKAAIKVIELVVQAVLESMLKGVPLRGRKIHVNDIVPPPPPKQKSVTVSKKKAGKATKGKAGKAGKAGNSAARHLDYTPPPPPGRS